MTVSYINYVMMIIGILVIFAAFVMLLIDKLKGEDMYFNIDVKEQELKKVMEDAEEIISELNYISDVVVQEIEDKIKNLQHAYSSIKAAPVVVQEVKPTIATIPVNIKTKPSEKSVKDKGVELKLTPKQQAVFDYANQGLNIVEIAKRLNMGQGEVKLILSLKNEGAQYE
ncbi:MAG: DUF6115 domain-containing protein [Bacillota bacterium]